MIRLPKPKDLEAIQRNYISMEYIGILKRIYINKTSTWIWIVAENGKLPRPKARQGWRVQAENAEVRAIR